MGWGGHDLTGFGRFLRQAREYKGVNLRDVEKKTRIPRRHLSALESEDFGQLPPLIYARGIVRNYAQFLGLDPVDALSRFEQSHGQRSGGFQVVPAVKTTEVPSHWAPNFAIIAFMVIMSAVIFAWMYSAYFAPPDEATPTEQAATTPEADQEVAVMEDEEDSPLAEGGGESILSAAGDDDEPADGESGDQSAEDDPGGNDEQAPAEGGASDSESTDSDTMSESQEDPSLASEPGEHVFTISADERVWVRATLDGEIVYDDVILPGSPVTLEGESLSLVSGNAPYVTVAVDGEDRGPMGEVWDAPNSYP
ncbi:MAG: RodZ domain-containing protein [Thermomicrobiaceae bacterium]